ncbi:PadR family transcriptional regulator [Kineococcus arenarius]|uniref:PadR family transcriptional regulator n=1 Tax=Kineococcus sp. SYSU DK007 TaxID=3383128 RepID=UPI003D7EDB4B
MKPFSFPFPDGPRRGEHRGHHPGRGRGPFAPGPDGRAAFGGFGPGGPGGPGWPFGGPGPRGRSGPRRPKGDVRAAVLVLLAEGPSNGYRIIGEVERRSDGAWKPSPGSVYPTLQQLQDEGLITADPADPKQFTLTEAGRALVQDELADAPPPWESVAERPSRGEFHDLGRQVQQVAGLLQQVAFTGRPGDLRRAGDALERCRQELLSLLAQDPRQGREAQEDAG